MGIEGYTIESELARGGMGVVYLARQAFPDRRVALKLLSPDLAADPDFRERFIRESNAAAATEHPNIVPIYGAGEVDGRLYLAMRYVEGTDLGTLIRRDGPLDTERAVAICSQVAAALDAAHARGLVHRDVKPGNVLIDMAGNAYLTDFGLITRNEVETGLTKTGQFMGTTAYCAPEQIKGEDVDARTDVYSLACVMFECLTGQPPFPRQNEAATLYAHLEETPTKPSARRAGISPELDVVVQTAMAKRPDWRYRSAGEMAVAAREAIGQPVSITIGRRPRSKWMWAAAGIVASAVVVVAIALALQDWGAPPAAREETTLSLRRGLLAVDPITGEIQQRLPGSMGVQSFDFVPTLVAGEGALWTTDPTGPIRVDPANGQVGSLPLSQCSFGARIDVALGAAWVACGARGTQVYRIDPFTLESKEIPIERGPVGGVPGGFPTGVHVDKETLWVCFDTGSLYRIDALNERVVEVVEGVNVDLCAIGEGSLWAVDRLGSTVTPVDLDTGRSSEPITVPGSIDQIAAGAGGVWLLDGDAGTVNRIDPGARTVGAPIGIGSGASSITSAFGAVWVTVPADRDIVRIDPLTADVQRIAVNAAAIWSAPDTRTGWLWLVVEPPADVGTGFG